MITAILLFPDVKAISNIFDMSAIIIAFPLLIIVASHDPTKTQQRFLLTLGAASHPIYVLHLPLAEALYWLSPSWIDKHAPLSGCLFIMLIIAIALGLEKSYDIPIRRWFSKKVLDSAKGSTVAQAA